jgi:transcription-repair coupling factor (superfamily II helicase)
LARLVKESEVDDLRTEMVDRFGPLPEVTEHLLELARLRIWAHGWGIRSIHLEGPYLVLGYTSRKKLDGLVARSDRRLRIADQASAYLPIGATAAGDGELFTAAKSLLRPAG